MKYRIVKSKNRLTASKDRYVAKVSHNQVIDFDSFIKDIEHNCSLTTADVRAAVDAIGESLARHLRQGDVVDLPHIGRFKMEMECRPFDDPKEFRKESHIKRFQLHVIPFSKNGSQPLYDGIKLTKE